MFVPPQFCAAVLLHHWYVKVPPSGDVAVMLMVAVAPALIVWPEGWTVMFGC
jgi:hypothetical protein